MMDTKLAFKPVARGDIEKFSKKELIDFFLGEQDIRFQLEKLAKELEEERIAIGDRYLILKNRAFAPKTERQPKTPKEKKDPKPPDDRKLLPSERYPDAEIMDQDVTLEPSPHCSLCDSEMVDSGMTEVSESITIIPKKYLIKRQHLHKYTCRSCHGQIITTPSPPRIKPGSSYDDDLIIDVGLSKYCDLIPIERYTSMASRQGFKGLPPNSLIELTHYLAEFLRPIYERIKAEVQSSKILHADETPHKMLEGAEKKSWYFWGFSTPTASYFECHGTRSGDVAYDFLRDSNCEILVSDVYSGYNKAIRIANKDRVSSNKVEIKPAFCNAHARRKLREIPGEDGKFFVENYAEIYRLKKEKKLSEMRIVFEKIKQRAEKAKERYSTKSHEYSAANYFLKNYEGLTRCAEDESIPIDNNSQERELRNPVIGRKTWYGTHSIKGAMTAQILFTIVQSCRLNNLNPREYFHNLVNNIHQQLPPLTPYQVVQSSLH